MTSRRRTRIATGRQTGFTTLAAALILSTGSGLSACADHVAVPAEITSCPCAAGAVCCSSGVCAPDEDACPAATEALSVSAKGVWTGYLENFQLSPDDSIKITIDLQADGTLAGRVVLGHDAPPAPATDPDAPWPPSVLDWMPILPSYIPGFAYDARNIRWEARRLRFDLAQYEAWQPWCALQQSYPTSFGTFSCIPGNTEIATTRNADGTQMCFARQDDGQQIPVECFKFQFCGISGPCACDATSCSARTDFSYSFDIALRDGVGDGSTSLTNGNIRLTQSRH